MSWTLQALLMGALTFTPQDMPLLPPDFAAEYRLADLDGNGEQDLALPHAVYFQSGGAFSSRNKAAPPSANEGPAGCDIWNETLYLRFSDGLQTARWEGAAWKVLSDQPLAWPNPGNEMVLPAYAAAGLKFERFLHDIDGDDTPELFMPDERGLRVYRRGGDGLYAEAGLIEVFPALQLSAVEGRRLWPEGERGVTFPARTMKCRYNIGGSTLTVASREEWPAAGGNLARYRASTFTINGATLGISPEQLSDGLTEPFPAHLKLVRLNDDAVPDVGGGACSFSQETPVAGPVYETRASTDGGRTFTVRRVRGYAPNQSFVDLNNDGRVDLVTESTGLFEGGLRETMGRCFAARDTSHAVRGYFQQPDGSFSAEPDIVGSFPIELDAPPAADTPMFGRYRAGELFCLTGDFNSDGLNDALVQERVDTLAIYLAAGGGFEALPAARLTIEGLDRFSVADYSGDGRSDVTVYRRDAPDERPSPAAILYLAGEGRQ